MSNLPQRALLTFCPYKTIITLPSCTPNWAKESCCMYYWVKDQGQSDRSYLWSNTSHHHNFQLWRGSMAGKKTYYKSVVVFLDSLSFTWSKDWNQSQNTLNSYPMTSCCLFWTNILLNTIMLCCPSAAWQNSKKKMLGKSWNFVYRILWIFLHSGIWWYLIHMYIMC